MRSLMKGKADLDAAAAHTIAAGMREVAEADGAHPEELALIDAFEADLPAGGGTVDLDTLATPAAKEAFLKSLVLVAYADGGVSAAERAVIDRYAVALGADAPKLTSLYVEVASSLLSRFAGVTLWRDEVAAIGREMGLGDSAIDAALDPSGDA